MADCTKHDELVREQAKLKSELSALKESVDNRNPRFFFSGLYKMLR